MTAGWTIETLHDGCAGCERAAGSAITHARVTGSVGATQVEDRRVNGELVVDHSATVARIRTVAEALDGDRCSACGSGSLWSGWFDAEGFAVPDGLGECRWTTYCQDCGEEQ